MLWDEALLESELLVRALAVGRLDSGWAAVWLTWSIFVTSFLTRNPWLRSLGRALHVDLKAFSVWLGMVLASHRHKLQVLCFCVPFKVRVPRQRGRLGPGSDRGSRVPAPEG